MRWAEEAAAILTRECGLLQEQFTVERLKDVLSVAYRRRARLNMLIGDAEKALAEVDAEYRAKLGEQLSI